MVALKSCTVTRPSLTLPPVESVHRVSTQINIKIEVCESWNSTPVTYEALGRQQSIASSVAKSEFTHDTATLAVESQQPLKPRASARFPRG
jgi:hypothetical protein